MCVCPYQFVHVWCSHDGHWAIAWQRNTRSRNGKENYINGTVVPEPPVFTLLQANTGKQIWGEESERWRDRDRKTVWTYVCVSLGELEKAFFSWQKLLSINIAWNRLQREMRGVICVNVNSFVPVLIAGLNHGWKVISSTKTCNSDVDNICKTKKKKKAITSRRSWRNNHLLIKDEHVNMLSK